MNRANVISEVVYGDTFIAYINGSHNESYNIYCNSSDICKIDCQSSLSCSKLYLHCFGTCYVDCDQDNGISCPNATVGSYLDWITPSPTTISSHVPSRYPTSINPTRIPSRVPTDVPTRNPSVIPTEIPSKIPSRIPSKIPSKIPSTIPSKMPSAIPSKKPSRFPSKILSRNPSIIPTDIPTFMNNNFNWTSFLYIVLYSNQLNVSNINYNYIYSKNLIWMVKEASVKVRYDLMDINDIDIIISSIEKFNNSNWNNINSNSNSNYQYATLIGFDVSIKNLWV